MKNDVGETRNHEHAIPLTEQKRHRRALIVTGTVQGVGFRPFVYGLAERHGLGGFVQNQVGAVRVEVEGPEAALDAFVQEIRDRPPPLARVENVRVEALEPSGAERFDIRESAGGRDGDVVIAPDIATCDDCLVELFDPSDRRHGYPFINCTNCGPRLSIVVSAPYDRERTTMRGFEMCAECRREYEDPRDRRFHAQPIACPRCGPRLTLAGSDQPLEECARRLCAGEIGAIKGLGGYHLACDASNDRAVEELRRRKHRDEKPFAVMVTDLDAARQLADVSAEEAALLSSKERPIVVLARRADAPLSNAVAPGVKTCGVMLPYTPLHHLLLRAVGRALVMTSGNRGNEPIAFEDDDARERLSDIADFFLSHDRPIHLRVEDSVSRVVSGAELPLRRARGFAPLSLRLSRPLARPILALGADLKSAFALGFGEHAVVSGHAGDLDDVSAFRAWAQGIRHYQRAYGVRPLRWAHDLHPDYASTRYACEQAGVELVAVQHHHAHLVSCLVDNAFDGPAIGVIFDGMGYGSDGAAWGGEFLVGDARHFERAACFTEVPLPGGDAAAREPWRMAVSHLHHAGIDPLTHAVAERENVRGLLRMIEAGVNAPLTSSVGRLFDAVACLANVADRTSHEGAAAMALEARALPGAAPYPFGLIEGTPLRVDTAPLIRSLVDDDVARVASRFHATLVDIVSAVVERIAARTGLSTVALSGGVFQNALLAETLRARLRLDGLSVLTHRSVPPNDGGISLGQLAIAGAR